MNFISDALDVMFFVGLSIVLLDLLELLPDLKVGFTLMGAYFVLRYLHSFLDAANACHRPE